jgi:hypothetical protein
MLVPSRLARGPWLARALLRIRYGFTQRPLCDLISASLGKGEKEMKNDKCRMMNGMQ